MGNLFQIMLTCWEGGNFGKTIHTMIGLPLYDSPGIRRVATPELPHARFNAKDIVKK